MLKLLFDLANPRDILASTAPFSFLLILFGQQPYKVIKSSETKQFELRTSIPGMLLCIGHFALYIASIWTYQFESYQVVETTLTTMSVIARQLISRAIAVAILATALLRRDLMKRYVRLLNQMDESFDETDRKFISRRIFYTVAAITISVTLFLITTIIYLQQSAHLLKVSKNSKITYIFTSIMPAIYVMIMAFHRVIIYLIIHWHFIWFNEKLSYVHGDDTYRCHSTIRSIRSRAIHR